MQCENKIDVATNKIAKKLANHKLACIFVKN